MKKQSILKFSRWEIPMLIAALFFFMQPRLSASSNDDASLQQQLQISGTITDANSGEFLPGVAIVVKGTTDGTITDIDGKYSLTVNTGDVLLYSFVGYINQEVEINGQTEVNIQLEVNVVGLDEVIVIGYGTQKKKLNTGSTINVKGEDIEKMNTSSAMDALKGISAGVSIRQDNGVPGSGNKIIIRGAGTIGDASPLYVVNGVPVDNIDFLAPSDIASIDILKDGASLAIYGSAAANGVILVTTKSGNGNQKPSISYDFFYGAQQIAKKPGLSNAQQYVELMNEAYDNDGTTRPNWARDVPDWESIENGSNPGVNWLEESYKENAPVISHALNITGGTKASIYSLGINYFMQEGIIGYQGNNSYERLTARLNSEHIIIERQDRSIFKVGENFTFSNWSNPSIATGGIYWNDMHNMLVTSPLLPMYTDDETDPAFPYHSATDYNAFETNPIGAIVYNRKYNENDNNRLVGNVYAEIEPIKNLKIRSSYGFDGGFGSSRTWGPDYQLSPKVFRRLDEVQQSQYQAYTYTFTNTITYDFNIANQHNFRVLGGYEAIKNTKDLSMFTSNDSSNFNDWGHAYISNTPPNKVEYIAFSGLDKFGYGKLSYFARLSYDFRETLLATVVYRADGSSKLAPGHQWGDFWSASLGYILTNHDFMKSVPGLNYLKIRGGWGQNGNDRIGDFRYASSLETNGGTYFYGNNRNIRTVGAYPSYAPNPNLTWETSEQTTIGFDANFLANKLQFTFDWYNKLTDDWLLLVPIPSSGGTDGSIQNAGAVRNRGIELALRWNEIRGDFSYGAIATFAYNKNEVTKINNAEGIIHGPSNVLKQGGSEMYRAEVGYPIGYFWMLETDGLLQNDTDVELYVNGEEEPYFPKAQPGDVRFVDQVTEYEDADGNIVVGQDGVINDDDKIMVGDPNPDYIFGFQIHADFRGLYLQIAANGQAGHQIAKSYRINSKDNFTESDLGRWHGEGTSTKIPRLSASAHSNYQLMSDIFIEDGDFLRISNVTIGYDFNRLFSKSFLQQARLYFTVQNLYTFTKYSGLDPEVGSYDGSSWASGIDLGLYPASKTYMVGLSVKF